MVFPSSAINDNLSLGDKANLHLHGPSSRASSAMGWFCGAKIPFVAVWREGGRTAKRLAHWELLRELGLHLPGGAGGSQGKPGITLGGKTAPSPVQELFPAAHAKG